MFLIRLWAAAIVFGVIAIVVKEKCVLSSKRTYFLITVYLSVTLLIHLAAIYFTAKKSSFFAMIAVMVFDFFWFSYQSLELNSDPAGNGMTLAFHKLHILIGPFVWGFVSFLFIRFLNPHGLRIGLYLVLAVAAWLGWIAFPKRHT